MANESIFDKAPPINVGFNEFLDIVSSDQLRAVIQDLRENQTLRSEIIEDLTRRNPDLLTELHRPDDEDVEDELTHVHLLDGLVILSALRRAYGKQREIESVISLFSSSETEREAA